MKEITATLRGADRIALVSHRDPDPDTIGSALALGLGLESLGKRVSWHCADPVPEQQRFLHGSERFTQDPPPESVDLVVTVDFGSVDRAKFALPARPTLVNIDHHASNDNFGTANLVDVTAAASAELVSRVIDALGIAWTPDMATAALVGIMTDTGSFQFPSTDARALDRAFDGLADAVAGVRGKDRDAALPAGLAPRRHDGEIARDTRGRAGDDAIGHFRAFERFTGPRLEARASSGSRAAQQHVHTGEDRIADEVVEPRGAHPNRARAHQIHRRPAFRRQQQEAEDR
jgi:hypothetical protein